MFTLQVGAPVISVESSVAGFEFATAEFEVFEFVIAEPVAGLVPEPGTYALFGVGGLMVIWAARRRAAKR